jgi:acyl-CoA thioester hydrolase
MKPFEMQIQIRWSDIDQNRHLRHSVYYDYGAMARMRFLAEHGLSLQKLEKMQVGPILFREEAIFRREVRLDDIVTINVALFKATADMSRWSLRHEFKHVDGTLATTIQVDGAWMDLEKRKLTVPSDYIFQVFDSIPKSEDFQLMHREPKA